MIKTREEQTRKILFMALVLLLILPLYKIFLAIENVPTVSVLFNIFNGVRDYTQFRLTHLIMSGQNPYSPDILFTSTTPFMNLYTALNPLIVAIFCKITGFSIIAGYHFMNFLLYFLTALNIYLIVKNFFENNEKIIAVLCILINSATFFALSIFPIFNFSPDAIGIFLTSLIFLIVYKNRNNVIALSLLSVLLIFTKQILCVMFIPLFTYYLVIQEKRAAIKYFLYCVIFGLITLVAIYIAFPLYWTETIFCQFGVLGNSGFLGKHGSIYNLLYFGYRYSMPLFIILIGILLVNKTISISKILKNLIHQDKFAIYLFLNLFWGTIFIFFFFGKNGGDSIKYCQDILAPSTFILMVYILNNYFARHWNCNKSQLKSAVLLFMLCVSTSITYYHFKFVLYSADDIKPYIELDQIIEAHNGKKMYLGMNSTQYMLKRDMWESNNICFDDGHIEYFLQHLNEEYNSILDNFLYMKNIKSALLEYITKVNESIKNKDFSIVTTLEIENGIINKNLLKENYYPFASYEMQTIINGIFNVTIWLPK